MPPVKLGTVWSEGAQVMTMEPSDRTEYVRTRRPHWQRKAFWKTFGTVLVIYIVLRVSITAASNWSKKQEAPAVEGTEEVAPDQ